MDLKKSVNAVNVSALIWIIAIMLVTTAGVERVQHVQPLESKVTKRDSYGRVKVMQAGGDEGTCVAEVVYDSEGRPRIYVVAMSYKGARNLGYLQINGGTGEGIGDEALMRNFKKAMEEHCLRL